MQQSRIIAARWTASLVITWWAASARTSSSEAARQQVLSGDRID
ncbi:MAG: hypothetical protein VCG02_06740 [Verrucomicrobiota bacterium]